MLFNGIKLVQGSELQNLTVESGSAFPNPAVEGELFYRNDGANEDLYIFNGAAWIRFQEYLGYTPANQAGDTLTGPLILFRNPVSSLEAATKQYVDTFQPSWTVILNKPSTISGYGITDAQPLNVQLTAISDLSTNGLMVKTGSGSASTVSIDGTTGQIAVANGDGISGNPTISLPNTGTAGTYYAVTTDAYGRVISGSTTLNSPTLTGVPTAPTAAIGSNSTVIATTAFVLGSSVASAAKWTALRILSLNGDGTASMFVDGSTDVSGVLTLATVNPNVGSFGAASSVPVFSVNSKGLVTAAANTSIAIAGSQVTSGTFADARVAQSSVTQHQAALTIAESQITNGSLLARVADNETVSGNWTFSNSVVGADPTIGTHFATKQYVDNITTGLDFKQSVRAATTTNIAFSGLQTIDGISLNDGDRVLVKDQAFGADNGIYVASTNSWSRATDADTNAEVSSGMYCFVEEGTSYASSGWVLTTANPITLGTTSLNFAQFTGLGQITAGDGLTKTGSTLSVKTASSSRISVSTSGIDLASIGTPGTYYSVTTDIYGRVIAGAALTSSDITTALGFSPANKAGDTFTGQVLNTNNINGDGSNFVVNTTTKDATLYAFEIQRNGSTVGGLHIDGVGSFATGTTINGQLAYHAGNLTNVSQLANNAQYITDTLNNATYLKAKNTTSTVGRILGVNASNNVMIGDIDNAFLALNFQASGSVVLTIDTTATNVAVGELQEAGSRVWTAATLANLSQLTNGPGYITSSASITGNAATATKLATARNINGVAFDGSANITIADSTKLPLAGGTMTGNITYNSATFSASGTTQGAATTLTDDVSIVTSSTAGTAVGVALPIGAAGMRLSVINTSANDITVWVQVASFLNGVQNSSVALRPNAALDFVASDSTHWFALSAVYQ